MSLTSLDERIESNKLLVDPKGQDMLLPFDKGQFAAMQAQLLDVIGTLMPIE